MSDILHNIAAGFSESSRLDQVNLVLGVVGVWLMICRKLAAFPVGMLSVAVQGVLFFKSRVYGDAMLQVFFFVTLGWGWWHWVRDKGGAPELPVTRLSLRGRLIVVALAAATTAVWALALKQWTDAIIPWRDAFIAAFSVAAQVLQARKNIENWPLWIVVNVVAIASYWSSVGAYTAFLYSIYLVLAVAGWREWRKAMA